MRQITIAAYSPTGVPRHLAETLAGYLSAEWRVLDFLNAEVRRTSFFFNQEDLIIFAAPSFMGRLPEDGIFDRIYANDTPGIFLAAYTGRTYGDMLLELAQVAEDRGVVGIGAAAIPVPQNSQVIADPEELARLKAFSGAMRRICRDIELDSEYVESHALKVRGRFPYHRYEERDSGAAQAGSAGEYFLMRPIKPRFLLRERTK